MGTFIYHIYKNTNLKEYTIVNNFNVFYYAYKIIEVYTHKFL